MPSDADDPVTRAVAEHVRSLMRKEVGEGGRGAQAELARSLGISPTQVSNCTNAEPTRNPGPDLWWKMARHTGVSYGELVSAALHEGFRSNHVSLPKPAQEALSARPHASDAARAALLRYSGPAIGRDGYLRIVDAVDAAIFLAMRDVEQTPLPPSNTVKRDRGR